MGGGRRWGGSGQEAMCVGELLTAVEEGYAFVESRERVVPARRRPVATHLDLRPHPAARLNVAATAHAEQDGGVVEEPRRAPCGPAQPAVRRLPKRRQSGWPMTWRGRSRRCARPRRS